MRPRTRARLGRTAVALAKRRPSPLGRAPAALVRSALTPRAGPTGPVGSGRGSTRLWRPGGHVGQGAFRFAVRASS